MDQPKQRMAELLWPVAAAALIVLAGYCDDSVPASPGLDAVLWVQTAPEYRAACRQAYAQARRSLDAALADPSWEALTPAGGGKPGRTPAVILDVDETVLDNSPYQTGLVRAGQGHSTRAFSRWVERRECRPVPGALEFCRYADSRGVQVRYVTNRHALIRSATTANLRALGFPNPDAVFPRGLTSDKEPRRQQLAAEHRILLLIGDNIRDFTEGELDAADWARFGQAWITLPNPMYGGWERAARRDAAGTTGVENKRLALRGPGGP